MEKYVIEDLQYQSVDHFNEKQLNNRDFHFTLFENIHPFYDGNGRTCKIFHLQLELGFCKIRY